MKIRTRSFLMLAFASAFLTAQSGGVFAQGAAGGGPRPLEIKDLAGSKVQTPEYQISKSQFKAKTRDWFRIDTTYDSQPEWLDEVTFTYFVLVKNKTAGGPPQSIFKGEVTYVNVQKGRHKSDMYLHPSTLARYGDVQAVAVVVSTGGRVVAIESKPSSNQRWWEQLQPTEGLVLNRMQTPFAMLYFDDYEAVKFTK